MDLVGVSEIGKMLSVSPQRADQLAKVPGFPKPAATLGSGRRVWTRAAIEKWARDTGRLKA